jgi:hypothetical protein
MARSGACQCNALAALDPVHNDVDGASRTVLAPTLTRSALRHCWLAGRRGPFWCASVS